MNTFLQTAHSTFVLFFSFRRFPNHIVFCFFNLGKLKKLENISFWTKVLVVGTGRFRNFKIIYIQFQEIICRRGFRGNQQQQKLGGQTMADKNGL